VREGFEDNFKKQSLLLQTWQNEL